MGWIPFLLAAAWLFPLASFAGILFFGRRLGPGGKGSAYVATGAILLSLVCVLLAAALWGSLCPLSPAGSPLHHSRGAQAPVVQTAFSDQQTCAPQFSPNPTHICDPLYRAPYQENPIQHHFAQITNTANVLLPSPHSPARSSSPTNPANNPPQTLSGNWWIFAEFGELKFPIGYYVDALTILMMLMVALVATCIHIYSWGYMAEELEEPVADYEISLSDGTPLFRPGRFPQYFQYLSLFCFSMFGLVLANNLFMIFVFWELVGICSYLLIGFYFERPGAVRAATKAFVVNRLGDFGMLLGIAAFWGATGTVCFADAPCRPGIFTLAAQVKHTNASDPQHLPQPNGLPVIHAQTSSTVDGLTYTLLILGGLGIFCGCVGKSAQFPLHVWLPDAMEGPTPVSALIHAATMVAAGVYLVGRFYPALTPEVLLVIAAVGAVSLFLAGTMALVATDIKRVLAFSTISQLGYMMFGLGIGGWVAGLFHLVTHAFFKALLFLCAGSVIHATHTGDINQLGGLFRKMPWTAISMLIGCLAIIGAGIPTWAGLSGFHSKDAIFAQAYLLASQHVLLGEIFLSIAVAGTVLTGLYMFRLWFLTFIGPARNPHRLEHVHESPPVMLVPIFILTILTVVSGWSIPLTDFSIPNLLHLVQPQSEGSLKSPIWPKWFIPPEMDSHSAEIHIPASWLAFSAGVLGVLTATIFYGLKWLDPGWLVRLFRPIYHLLWHRWFIDWLYEKTIVGTSLKTADIVAWIDQRVIDPILDGCAQVVCAFAFLQDRFDQQLLDRAVNLIGHSAYRVGSQIRKVQTGLLRQYLALGVAGMVILFCLAQFAWWVGWF